MRVSEGGLRQTKERLLPEAESIFAITAWVKNASNMPKELESESQKITPLGK